MTSPTVPEPRFADRREAGRQLAARLLDHRDSDCVVLALPRGGVPVAFEVARALAAPLDLMFVRKIGAPGNPEVGVGAVTDGAVPQVLLNEDLPKRLRPPEKELTRQIEILRQEIARRRMLYLAGRDPVPVGGRTAILVDDGIATGATMRLAVQALARSEPSAIVVATPVAPPEVIESLRAGTDDIVCLLMPERFRAVGLHYTDFHQLGDDEVIDFMQQATTGR